MKQPPDLGLVVAYTVYFTKTIYQKVVQVIRFLWYENGFCR